MRLNHIYITKEGEPMANPYQDAPQFSAWDMLSPATQTDKLIKEYHSGLLGFERKDLVIAGMFVEEIAPDTLIPVDLEVEVVEQMDIGDGWVDRDYHDKPAASNVEYRSALRIKP